MPVLMRRVTFRLTVSRVHDADGVNGFLPGRYLHITVCAQ